MQIARTVAQLAAARRELILRHFNISRLRPLVGLTPTMGALHAGHYALIKRMSEECAIGVVSLFVNPRQFGPHEDFARYPQLFDADVALCEEAGVPVVFAPSVEEMYPAGYATSVSVSGLTGRWCGASRPGHFDGVATVVAKLFTICTPDKAYFGEKDYQQLLCVERMARDLNLGVEIVPCPTVREADGLALSSRNAYLSGEERISAPRLQQALQAMARSFAAGEGDPAALVQAGTAVLAGGGGPQFELEYLAVVNPYTLAPVEQAHSGDRVLAAARLGTTRLIDNIALP